MAITGAAAIAGGIATAGGVAAGVTLTTMATIVGVAGLALTAVGMITGTPWLTKIGGGLGLAGGVASAGSAIGSAAGAAGTAADATTTGINSASVADTVGAGSQAAGDVAATNLATDGVTVGGPMAATSGVTASPLGDVAASSYGGVEAGTSAAGGAVQGATSTPIDAATQAALNPAQGTSINYNLASQSPASQVMADSGPNFNPVNTNAVNDNAANFNPPNTVANNIATDSSVTPGSQAPLGSAQQAAVNSPVGVTGDGAPYGFSNPNGLDAGTLNGTGSITPPSSFAGQLWKAVSDWWGNAGDKTQAAVLQGGLGFLGQAGKGALEMMGTNATLAQKQQLQDFQMRNMSGAGSVPKVGVAPSNGANPYTNANNQAMTTATTTPAFPARAPGLINSAQV